MFTFKEGCTYQMPVHFSGFKGSFASLDYWDVTSLRMCCRTEREAVEQYVPPCFSVLRADLECCFAQCRGVDWMGGAGYNLIAVSVPVVYLPEKLEGCYNLVTWENVTDPILGGREQTGVPKLYADITDLRVQRTTRLAVTASCGGNAFLQMRGERGRPWTPDEVAARNGVGNLFGWRCIPHIGKPGMALSHPTLYPQEYINSEVWDVDGHIQWQEFAPELPQSHIVRRLAALPLLGYGPCSLGRGRMVLHVEGARQLAE